VSGFCLEQLRFTFSAMPPLPNSYWLTTAPAFDSSSAPLPEQTEIAILGAGIMGCSLAYWLTRHGQRPLVIERNAHPAGGASGRNGGLMVAGPSQAYHQAVQQLGREAAREIMRATLINRELLAEVLAREAIDALYRAVGFMALALPNEVTEMQATVRDLQADGFAGDWLERAEAEQRLGTTLGADYVGATYHLGDGQIHSARYAFGVAEAARRGGALFAFNTAAQAIAPAAHDNGWLIQTSRGAVVAHQLVITLNAWAGEVVPELKSIITPTRGHVILTAPVNFNLTPWVANDGWDYGRQLDNGQLLIGGRRVVRPDLDLGQGPPPGENVPPIAPEVITALSDIAPQIFPALADVSVVYHWTGTMAFTPDHQPLVGRWPGHENLWLMAGFSGHGMPFSQALPHALAAQLVEVEGPTLPAAFDPMRFRLER
jgi:gamma-glutamylputrescine oxidase